MPADDREVWRHFNLRSADTREVTELAYAKFTRSQYEWMAHVETRDGSAPSQSDVIRWIADLPDSYLETIRLYAIDSFDLAARSYMAAEIERAVESARDDAIVREIRASNEAIVAQVTRATAFGSTFLPNLFIGVVASVAFSVLVIGASLIFARDPSPFALYRGLQPSPPAEP